MFREKLVIACAPSLLCLFTFCDFSLILMLLNLQTMGREGDRERGGESVCVCVCV